jgi:hypothetical protein
MVYWRLFVNDRLNPHGGKGHWKKVLKYEFDLIRVYRRRGRVAFP